MANSERRLDSPDFQSYFAEVASLEGGLLRILTDYSEGRLSKDDLEAMDAEYCNVFPPIVFFTTDEFRQTFTPKRAMEAIRGVTSPEGFARTKLFKDIMEDDTVIERFMAASSFAPSFPAYWPEEFRDITVKRRRDDIATVFTVDPKR